LTKIKSFTIAETLMFVGRRDCITPGFLPFALRVGVAFAPPFKIVPDNFVESCSRPIAI